VACVIVAALACSSSRDSPLMTQVDVGTPTPTPLPTATPLPGQAGNVGGVQASATQTPLDVVGKDIIKIANWQDKSLALENNLIGYFMVWGFGYTVDLVDIEPTEYGAAIEEGLIDLVLEVDTTDSEVAAWLNGAVESGSVIDAGTLFTTTQNIRIAMHPSMIDRAPDLVEFLGEAAPGDQTIADIAKNVTFGRVGLTPSGASIKYLQENEDVWTTWMPEEVATEVRAALAARKTSLRNRTCIPRGVEANDCGRN
jgi:ABC-type proline/glycine betaine transport system substrate-binding protein